MRPLRLLWICPTVPFPPTNGQQLRNAAILRGLIQMGHAVRLAAFGPPPAAWKEHAQLRHLSSLTAIPQKLAYQALTRNYAGRLRNLVSKLPYSVARYRSEPMREALCEVLAAGKVDAVLCEGVHTMINLPARLSVPIVVDNHNLEHRLVEQFAGQARNPLKRAYAALEARKLRAWEVRANLRASVALVCSKADRAALQRRCPELPVAVVPNAIDTDRYHPVAEEEDLRTIVFSGGMDWLPNQQAVEWLARDILPVIRQTAPVVQVVIAGRAPADDFRRRFSGIPGLRFTGTVPDIRVEIARAAVCVVPLRLGSGTRLKILEAAAMGKAIVSTTVGAEGLDFCSGREILLADTAALFGRTVADLLANPHRRRELGFNARRLVQQKYSIPVLCGTLAEAFGMLTRM